MEDCKVEEKVKCLNCGADLNSEEVFCSKCGTKKGENKSQKV